jgi:hypothetical protein
MYDATRREFLDGDKPVPGKGERRARVALFMKNKVFRTGAWDQRVKIWPAGWRVATARLPDATAGRS